MHCVDSSPFRVQDADAVHILVTILLSFSLTVGASNTGLLCFNMVSWENDCRPNDVRLCATTFCTQRTHKMRHCRTPMKSACAHQEHNQASFLCVCVQEPLLSRKPYLPLPSHQQSRPPTPPKATKMQMSLGPLLRLNLSAGFRCGKMEGMWEGREGLRCWGRGNQGSCGAVKEESSDLSPMILKDKGGWGGCLVGMPVGALQRKCQYFSPTVERKGLRYKKNR